MTDYLDTRASLARATEVSAQTITNYAKSGLLDYVFTSDGRMLFKKGQVEKVKALYRESIHRRAANMRRVRAAKRAERAV